MPPTGAQLLRARSGNAGPDRTVVNDGSGLVSLTEQQFYALLPAVYRTKDAPTGQLQALFEVLAAQSAIVEDNIEQLYDDQFIETCAPWVDPIHRRPDRLQLDLRDRLGQLRQPRRGGEHDRLPPPQGHADRAGAGLDRRVRAGRARGRGVPAPDHHGEHAARPRRTTTPPWTCAIGRRSISLGTAFDQLTRTIDVRRIAPRVRMVATPDAAPLDIALHGPGRFNIPDVAIHLWRWQS